MLKLDSVTVKTMKTMGLLFVFNSVLASSEALNGVSGALLRSFLNVALLATLHDIGVERRPGGNFTAGLASLFASESTRRNILMNNAVRNTVNGGAAVFDAAVDYIPNPFRR